MQLHKYEENYGEALEGFFRAAALDPAWPEAATPGGARPGFPLAFLQAELPMRPDQLQGTNADLKEALCSYLVSGASI